MKLDQAALDAHPLPPVVDGGKETKGRVLIVAGSREVPGAAMLAATAAMRAGAGKLRIATIESAAPDLGISMPEAMVMSLPEDEGGGFAAEAVAALREHACDSDAVIAGPGMKSNDTCAAISNMLLGCAPALALDAALLHSLSAEEARHATRPALPLLLPHAGELASLLDCDEQEVERDPTGCGRRAAKRFRALVLVKGVVSHVVTPGDEVWTYEGGAPGLGVSGSGDVLAGIAGGLLARGAEPLNALLWSVWLHGQAGASLAGKIGPIGFLAREIAAEIPALLPR